MQTVVVTDGEQRSALATVRSLGRAGYRVHVCSSRATSLAASSRFCAGNHVVADALRAPDQFADDVRRVVAATQARVLLPVTEASLLAVLPRRAEFECVIPFPDAAAFRAICDKREVLRRAADHGIAAPAQSVAATPEDRPERDALPYPVVLKPSRSVADDGATRVRSSVSYASSPEALRQQLDRYPAGVFPVLLQQRVEGPGFAISVLLWDGELRAAFAHRRIREKPPSGGVSVVRESIPLDDALLARSVALLRDFDWQGVAMVEFKLDARTGTPYLMEINGRLWGSLQLAIDAGIDFPRLLVELALGRRPDAMTTYPESVKSRWGWGDVDHFLACLMRSEESLALPASAPRRSRLRSVAQFIGSLSSDAYPEIGQSGDMRPLLRETIDWFRGR
jgi:predicted ATP-grasp superfamily ATP-dependent carboligase